MSKWQIIGLVIAYLAFGFALGVMREWAAQSIEKGDGSLMRRFCAYLSFPCSMSDRHGFINDFFKTDIPLSVQPMLEHTGGGFFYWNATALVWPILVFWSCYIVAFFTVCVLAKGGIGLLALPGQICQKCELAVKRTCGITK